MQKVVQGTFVVCCLIWKFASASSPSDYHCQEQHLHHHRIVYYKRSLGWRGRNHGWKNKNE
ncbi:hypothetical protein C5167_015181 [Papaver somniferum]|uniref:Uncharacterized protein n=1 Tax=Papaver somniferum TaxID=3469 RepID=A0A4Y7J5A7_PAPSO|nr:hypothetical protein C5167_015181 [Papaver somniferum]